MKNQGVFIGLGGAGVYATAHLKAKLLRAADGDKKKLNGQHRFLFVDTDKDAYTQMNEAYATEFGGQQLIDDDWVPLSFVNPLYIFRQATDKAQQQTAEPSHQHLLSFVDEKSAASFKPFRLEDGASANRQQGRVAVWSEWSVLRRKLSALIRDLKSPSNPDFSPLSIPFYLLSGTCGGTGSSLFLDVAYLLDRIVKSHFKEREPSVRAVLFMPEWYIQRYRKDADEEIVRKYQSNAYAFFEELNFFMKDYYSGEEKDKGTKFEKLFVAPDIEDQVEGYNKKWGVFNFAICVDSTSEQEGMFDDEQMYVNTAEMLYYWQQSEVQGTFISSFDNQLRDHYLGKKRVPAFITMGYRALQFPGDIMKEYFSARFLYEFFRYGLLDGEGEAARAYLASEPGKAWLREAVNRVVSRHLFAQHSEEDVPNLEAAAAPLLANALDAVEDEMSMFHKGAGDSSGWWTSPVKHFLSRESPYAFQKVGDVNLLRQFKTAFEDQIANVTGTLERRFAGHEDAPTSRLRLAASLALSAEQVIEDAILAFGINGAAVIARELRRAIADLRREFQARREALARELERLSREADIAEEACLKEKNDQSLSDLNDVLERWLHTAHAAAIAQQQASVLNEISQEKGVLSAYAANLVLMSSEVARRLRVRSANGDEVSLEELFTRELPGRISMMRDNVTTSYIPSLDGFLKDGGFNPYHEITRTYDTLVTQASAGNGSHGPLRRNPSGDIWADPQGLHDMMSRMFADQELMAGRGVQLDGGRGCFFRKYFRDPSPASHREMVRGLEAIARQMASRLMEEKGFSAGLKNVHVAFASLSPTERERIKQDFVGRTETFCKMDESAAGKPHELSVYAGTSVDFAALLGYSEGSTSRFVETNDPNRFLHIKAKALWTIDQYPHYEQYRLIYDKQRSRKGNGHDIFFSPHIHKLFNELGVEAGMRRLLRPGENFDMYILTLLYDRVFQIAHAEYFPLFREMVYWVPGYAGGVTTEVSPILTQQNGKVAEVRLAEKVGLKGGKLLFERGSFKIVINPVLNFKQLFNRIEAEYPNVFPVWQKVDEQFRQTCSREWANDDGPLAKAAALLDARLSTISNSGNHVIPDKVLGWHGQMRNRLRELAEELATHTRRQLKTMRLYTGTPDDEDEPDLHNNLLA